MKKHEWTVYIIESESGKLYTGITNNLEKRFKDHQLQKNSGAKFFRISKPKSIVYTEFFENRSAASKREAAIKKLSREQKLQLINKIS